MRSAGRIGSACLVAVLLLAAAKADAASITVRADPPLEPGFSTKETDYVTRCTSTHGRVKLRVNGRTRSLKLKPGQAARFATKYHVRCLPEDFPKFTSTRHGTPQANYYVVTPNYPLFGHETKTRYAAIFDNRGAPVWWAEGEPNREVDDAKLLPNGHLAWSNNLIGYYGWSDTNRFEEHRLDGTLVTTSKTQGSPTDFHELEPVAHASGHHMLITYRRREHQDMTSCGGENAPSDFPVTDGEIQELDARGHVTWTWNTHTDGNLALDETGRYCPYTWSLAQALGDAADNVHANAVETFRNNEGRDKVLLSAARLDAVYQIDKATKQIDWKLGGTTTDKSLAIENDDEYAPWHFGGQHDVRRLDDGTITLFDNETADARPPRAVRFRIDEATKTATRIESLTDPKATLSFCCGSARKLPGGNWVAGWGYQPYVTEMTPKGKVVFRLTFGGVYSYRADPVLKGHLSRAKLRRAMNSLSRRRSAP